jgi:hypothetical protein
MAGQTGKAFFFGKIESEITVMSIQNKQKCNYIHGIETLTI